MERGRLNFLYLCLPPLEWDPDECPLEDPRETDPRDPEELPRDDRVPEEPPEDREDDEFP